MIEQALVLANRYRTVLRRNGFVTPERLACFFGRAIAEVGPELKAKREDGYYTTIKRARDVFHTPFLGKGDDFVSKYLKNSKKMLSYVYANRMGNGPEWSGDGYFFRGGGIYQITGEYEYIQLSISTGISFDQNPDLITDETNSMIAAMWYWNNRKLHSHADRMDIDAIGDLVNKGRLTKAHGDAHRFDIQKKATELLLEAFKQQIESEKVAQNLKTNKLT